MFFNEYLLHRSIDFISLFYGLPLIIFFTFSNLFNILDKNLSKRKNINSFNIKINLISGKNTTYNFFSKIACIYLIISLTLLCFSKAYFVNNYFSEISITNTTIVVISTICLIIILLLFFNLNNRTVSFKQNLNWTFTILILVLPYIYMYNSLVFLFFFIEIISIIIFLFILNSFNTFDILNKKKKIESLNINVNTKKIAPNYKYCSFIYYWLSFFSSIFFFLFISIISFKYYFIDILMLKILLSELFLHNQKLILIYDLLTLILTVLISIKFGLPPFHLQKITVYKGLPISLSLLYSIFVILGYFFIFINFFYINPELFNNIKLLFKVILLFAIPYILIILFKELNIKAFFGYSSILNISLLFLIITI